MNRLEINIKTKEDFLMPQVIEVGDWIDLMANEDVLVLPPTLNILTNELEFNSGAIDLGIAMHLPEGYEAIVAPRSSTFKKFGIIIPNSIGIIDNSYNGDEDYWKLPYVGIKKGIIYKGDRIAQFRIQPSQFKDKEVLLNKVESLNNPNRGGFGSTGTR